MKQPLFGVKTSREPWALAQTMKPNPPFFHSQEEPLLTTENQVFVWGRNDDGQLGLGHWNDELSPKLLQFPSPLKVTKIGCGGFISAAALWMWGDNNVGQLGLGDTHKRPSPTKVSLYQIPEPIATLIGAREHTMALTTSGNLYVWGGNSRGELGLGDLAERHVPTLHPMKDIAQISCNLYNTRALTKSGDLYEWGLIEASDYATGNFSPTPMLFMNSVSQISCGAYHSLAVLLDGSLVSWGSNSDGQLGVPGAETSNEIRKVQWTAQEVKILISV
jgi:alpha-tubulin suppressor-like RCC1 family protein